MGINGSHNGQGTATRRAAIIIALAGYSVMVAMHMVGIMTDKSDFDVGALAGHAKRRVFHIAVLMNDRHGSVRMGAMERRKNESHGQEYEKAGEKAVPFHDPEKRA